jgi:hypothetical protein
MEDEDGDLDDDEDEEDEQVDFFKMLENAKIEFKDDENPIPAEVEEDENGGSKFKPGAGKSGDKSGIMGLGDDGMGGDEDEDDDGGDDDMMVDDY